LPQIPKSMVVIGAGAVGVEFGSIFKSFGSEITIVEYLPRMVPNEDEEVSKELSRVFRKRGIEAHTGAKVDKVEKTKDGVKVTFTAADGKQVVKEAEKVLVAVGRAPRTANVGLESTKVEVERGFVKTDEWMQTAEPGIYAIGDIVAGSYGGHGGGRQASRQAGAAGAARPHPCLHVLRTADRQRRPDRSPGQGQGS
jgi:dihydrolipoamide dehydrogenase